MSEAGNSIEEWVTKVESLDPPQLLEAAIERFHPRIAFASSFGAEDVVLIDMLARLRKDVRIFTLDTGRLHEETYELMETIRNRYGVTIDSYFPRRESVERMEREKGFHSFRRSIDDRKECCGIRKLEPLSRALAGLDAWIAGLRREQAVTRAGVPRISVDAANGGLLKINPLADWTQEQVDDYIREHDVPFNALHTRGFPSIGCAPCTRAILPGEDLRAGRWWWETPEQKECGLHAAGDGRRPPA